MRSYCLSARVGFDALWLLLNSLIGKSEGIAIKPDPAIISRRLACVAVPFFYRAMSTRGRSWLWLKGGTAPSRVALLRVGVLGAILIVVVVRILLGRI